TLVYLLGRKRRTRAFTSREVAGAARAAALHVAAHRTFAKPAAALLWLRAKLAEVEQAHPLAATRVAPALTTHPRRSAVAALAHLVAGTGQVVAQEHLAVFTVAVSAGPAVCRDSAIKFAT